MNFWDFSSPIYDLAQNTNSKAYNSMIQTTVELIPTGSTVVELAAGTGSISIEVAEKASSVVCTDLSDKMLNVARKKSKKKGVSNISFQKCNIFDTKFPDKSYDYVIASQVLHLIKEPEKALLEILRISKKGIIINIPFTKGINGIAKVSVSIWKRFGFSPEIELSPETFLPFIENIGLKNAKIIQIKGKIPMGIAFKQLIVNNE